MKYKIAWIVSLVLLTVMASTFLIMPYTSEVVTMTYKTPVIVVSSVFWFSLLGGYSVFLITSKIRKKKKPMEDEKIGFIRFFGDAFLSFIDTAFLMSVIWLIVNVISKNTENYVIYINIFILIFSFNMHCLFSSNLYKYIAKRDEGETIL